MILQSLLICKSFIQQIIFIWSEFLTRIISMEIELMDIHF